MTKQKTDKNTSVNHSRKTYDVVIIGGGLAGMTTACILGRNNISCALIDIADPADLHDPAFDGRTTAISYGSRQVLKAAGIWERLENDGCAIKTIHILDGSSPSILEFDHQDIGNDPFGWIFENRILRREMFKTIQDNKNIHYIAPARVKDFVVDADQIKTYIDDGLEISGQLVIGADGRGSFVRNWMGMGTRKWSYKQQAIVCTVTHDNPHKNIAVEHFQPEGPFAVLPMTDTVDGIHRSSVVWTRHSDKDGLAPLSFDQDTFDTALTTLFPSWYGHVRQIEKRYSFPLGLVHAHHYVADRMALIADAAHGIHPIAGQGLNLGLRDVATLCDLISKAKSNGKDIGTADILKSYERARRFDNMAMAGTTDALNKLFSNNIAPVKLARRIGLKLVSKTPPAKRFFMKQAMGAAGILPDLIKQQKQL